MNNTSVRELNIEDPGIVAGGLRKQRMYAIASCIANVKYGNQTMDDIYNELLGL